MIGNKTFRLSLMVITLCIAPTLYAAKVIRGDANGDGKLSMADLTKMIRLLGSGQSPATLLKATPALDVDKDGSFTIKDITALVQVIVGKAQPETITVSGGFTDDDQTSPGSDSNKGGFTDDDQTSPSTEGGGGGFKDDDMTDPS